MNQVRVVSIAVSRRWARIESNGARLDPPRNRSTHGSAPERRGAVVSRLPRPGTGRPQRVGEPQPRCRSAGPPCPPIALPALRRCWPHRQRLAIAPRTGSQSTRAPSRSPGTRPSPNASPAVDTAKRRKRSSGRCTLSAAQGGYLSTSGSLRMCRRPARTTRAPTRSC